MFDNIKQKLEEELKADNSSKDYIKSELDLLKRIEKAPDLKGEFVIYVEWKKNRTWGMTCRARTNKGFRSRVISGCGYDKLSTATAEALNSNLSILKELCKIKNKKENINKKNREIFGYGLTSEIIPKFSGGVGFGTHRRILEDLGFMVDHYPAEYTDTIIITWDTRTESEKFWDACDSYWISEGSKE